MRWRCSPHGEVKGNIAHYSKLQRSPGLANTACVLFVIVVASLLPVLLFPQVRCSSCSSLLPSSLSLPLAEQTAQYYHRLWGVLVRHRNSHTPQFNFLSPSSLAFPSPQSRRLNCASISCHGLMRPSLAEKGRTRLRHKTSSSARIPGNIRAWAPHFFVVLVPGTREKVALGCRIHEATNEVTDDN